MKKKKTHLDLFSGIGGFALAARWAGIETMQFVENEEFAQKVLTKNFPGVPIHENIKTYRANGIVQPFLLTGGYPCQPFSQAGKRRGQNDDRHLWPEMFRIIQECRPTWVLAENVSGHIKLGLEEVLTDLESEGYQSQVFHIGAVAKDAPHRRMRVWIVAYTNSKSESNGSQYEQWMETEDVANSQYSPDRTKRGEEREEESIQGVNREERLSGLPGGTGSNSRDVADSNSKREIGNKSEYREGCGFESRSEDVANSKSIKSGEQTKSEGGQNITRGSLDSRGYKGKRPEDVANSNSKGLQGFRGEHELRETGEKKQVSRSSDVADSDSKRRRLRKTNREDAEDVGEPSRCEEHWEGEPIPGLGGTLSDGISTWMDEPDIPRVGVKIPDRTKRLKAIGNSIVPEIAYEIIRRMT